MYTRILFPLLLVLFSYPLFSQITMDVDPSNGNANCEYGILLENHSGYLAWLNNNGGGVASTTCGGDVTWTVDNINISYEGCNAGYFSVYWDLTDDCGNGSSAYGSYYVYSDSPNINIPDLILDCAAPGNDLLVEDWLNTLGGASINSACAPDSDYIVTNDYDGMLSSCGSYNYVDFTIGDACEANLFGYYGVIIIESSEVDFASNSFFGDEGSGVLEFCIEVSGGNLDAAIDFDIAFSEYAYSNPATNGVDYGPVDTVTYNIPAGPPGIHCFSINLIDDLLIEPDERITAELINLVSPLNEAFIHYTDEATLIIDDDDDIDNDGVENTVDNCPEHSNYLQEDIDGDGIGNPCDDNNVVSELQTIESNLFLDSNSSGVITRSPDGTCWLMFVRDDGNIATVKVVCP